MRVLTRMEGESLAFVTRTYGTWRMVSWHPDKERRWRHSSNLRSRL